MPKFVVSVKRDLLPGIHKIGTFQKDEFRPVADLPLPNRVEIEMDGGRQDPCVMYRYTDGGEFCGDTWHENLDAAFDKAKSEYGLIEDDFSQADE